MYIVDIIDDILKTAHDYKISIHYPTGEIYGAKEIPTAFSKSVKNWIQFVKTLSPSHQIELEKLNDIYMTIYYDHAKPSFKSKDSFYLGYYCMVTCNDDRGQSYKVFPNLNS